MEGKEVITTYTYVGGDNLSLHEIEALVAEMYNPHTNPERLKELHRLIEIRVEK